MLEVKFKVIEQMGAFNARGRKRVLKKALSMAAHHWLNRFFPQHFDPVAYFRYGNIYTERRTKTKAERPLFETGTMMSQLRLTAKVSGTSKRAVITMRGPAYLAKRNRWINKIRELTAITKPEARKLAIKMEQAIPHLVRQDKERKTTVIK